MDMIKMIGKAARNDYLVAFFNALALENTKLEATVDKFEGYSIPAIFNDITISFWEKWLGLSETTNWNIEDRRERIIYTINSNQCCTKQFLKSQAMIFTNGEIEIFEDFSKYHFTIQFTSIIGVPPNLDNFKQMVNVNKPAHLTFDIKFRYRIWRELEPFTWEQLEKYIWEELYSKPILDKRGEK